MAGAYRDPLVSMPELQHPGNAETAPDDDVAGTHGIRRISDDGRRL
jgi:hypothetical protein